MARAELIHQSRKFRLERREVTLADGSRHELDIVVHPGATVILPVLDDGRVVFVRVYRAPMEQELLELPAGTLEPPEPLNVCAERELAEETGYRAGRLEPLIAFYSCPGFCSELLNVFLATDLTPGAQDLDDSEQIETHTMTLEDALTAIDERRIIDAKTIATLLYYDRTLRKQGKRA